MGYGRDRVMAIMRYALDYLGLERLDSDIISYNEASHATTIMLWLRTPDTGIDKALSLGEPSTPSAPPLLEGRYPL